MNTPDPGYQPPDAPVHPPPDGDRGSLMTGFVMGWVVLIGATTLAGMLIGVLSSIVTRSPEGAPVVLGLIGMLPLVSMIGLLVWFAAKGKPRSAIGVALTFASLIALALLLIAACFGLFATSSFR